MEICICGSTSFERLHTHDIGFDHNNYLDITTTKSYSVCKVCSSVYRTDNSLRDPFTENYFNYDAIRQCSRRDNRNLEISNLVSHFYEYSSEFTVCDFGASDGSLLLQIKKSFPNSKIVAIDINLEELHQKGIDSYHTLAEAFSNYKIDLLVTSNSLLYTDYTDFRAILHKYRPANVLITGPNHIVRSAQLFYDDVLTNASPFGIVQMMLNSNYSINAELASRSSSELEFTLLSQYQGQHKNILHNPLDNIQINLVKNKTDILNTYHQQYMNEATHPIVSIFGTSIDSAILSSFHSGPVQYIKDNALNGETFRGYPVLDVSDCQLDIIVPVLMNNAKRIRQRFLRD